MLNRSIAGTGLSPSVVLARMGQSPFNRSIWSGFVNAFRTLGCYVQDVDAKQVPLPPSLKALPDLLFSVHGGTVPVQTVDIYRANGVTTAVYLLDEPYEVDQSCRWAKHYDWVFSVDRVTVPVHSRYSNAVHLPLGYDETVFHPEGPGIPSDILILGSPFGARIELLQPVLSKWGDRITWVGPHWRKFCSIGTHYENFAGPEDCARFYRGAKVILNIHRDSCWSHFGNFNSRKLAATHLNPRFWEAAACRSCQLCTPRDDLETYAPETIVFKTPEQLDQQLQYLLGDPSWREENARILYERIKTHNYIHRAEEILKAVGLSGSANALIPG